MGFVKANYKKDPDVSFGAQAKILGEEFKKLTPSERQKWDDMAKEDKKRYEQQMENYKPSPLLNSIKGKTKKAKKDPNAPKKNQNAYIHFGTEAREKIKKKMPNLSLGDMSKQI